MRLIFMGTPHFAVPTLEAIAAAGHSVLSVYTQPDRPKGRGHQVALSPVKEAAIKLGLEVRQPERIRTPEAHRELQAFAADAMVVVGYGKIIPQNIIDIPRYGILNVHASLLPKYRGAAPIQWSIANGETVTGVTTMRIDAGLDTGDMLLRTETQIGPEENAIELGGRLAVIGAELCVATLREVEDGSATATPQDGNQASYAPVLKKEDGLVDWNLTARELYNRSRGFLPWPGTYTYFRGHLLHIWKAKPAYDISLGISGSLYAVERRLLAACGQGTTLEIEEVQLEGRKRITAQAFLNGQRLRENEILGETRN